MHRSTLGHGLALSAVSALLVSGLTWAAPAHAADVGVRLLTQQDGIASVKRDDDAPEGSTVTLTAERLTQDADVGFEFNTDPSAGNDAAGWMSITPTGSVLRQPYFAAEWTPTPEVVGTTIALRAVATTATTTTYSTPRSVALSGDASPVQSVMLDRDADNGVGRYFDQPYASSSRTGSLTRVIGTTSATSGTVELTAWNARAGAFQGSTDAAVEPDTFKTTPGSPVTVGGGRFNAILDISAFDADDGETLAVRAERDTDDVLPVELRAQTISGIVAYSPETRPRDSLVTIEVRDQDQSPVIGAEVRRASDEALVGYTDTWGQAVATQPNSSSESYYVNTTDVDAFEDGVDEVTGPVETLAYSPQLGGTAAVLADGDVFDDREYATGDVALQIVDRYGEPFASEQEVSYELRPSDAAPATRTTATTDADGRLVVPFDPSGPDGEYTLTFTGPAQLGTYDEEPVTFVAGDAVLGLTPPSGTATSGADIAYAGSLTVEGQPLPGRTIDLAYTRGTEQAPGTEADAAMLLGGGRVLTGATTTGADGAFSVTVDDLVDTGNPAELGGRLRADALGDSRESTADFTAGPPAPVTAPPTPTTTPTTPTTTPTQAKGKLTLTGSSARRGKDKLKVTGLPAAAGARVMIMAKAPGGKFHRVKVVTLGPTGKAKLKIRDRNGRTVTRYYATMQATTAVSGATSKVLRLR